jgi:hypothetical protein
MVITHHSTGKGDIIVNLPNMINCAILDVKDMKITMKEPIKSFSLVEPYKKYF